MDREPESTPLPLVLDTRVDGSVNFTALSLLPTSHGSTGSAVNGGRRSHVPVAGSKDWLSSMVEVGRQEVRTTARVNERMKGDHRVYVRYVI